MRRTCWPAALFFAASCVVPLSSLAEEQLCRDSEECKALGAQMCQSLPGYDWFQTQFLFDDHTTIGQVNLFPHSLFVQIRTKQPSLVDAARWWNPLKANQPTYDWNAFREAYQEASNQVARHPWIADWKRLSSGRAVEAQLLGTSMAESDLERDTFHLAWQDAGFSGLPSAALLLRRPNGGSVGILLGRSEPRALAVFNSLRPGDEASGHWADVMELSFHPRGHRDEYYSTFVVISPSGEPEVKIYSKALPPEARKPVIADYSGGDGSSFERAVIIQGANENEIEDAELNYVDEHFPGAIRGRRDWAVHHDRTYHVMILYTRDATKQTLYVDITSTFPTK